MLRNHQGWLRRLGVPQALLLNGGGASFTILNALFLIINIMLLMGVIGVGGRGSGSSGGGAQQQRSRGSASSAALGGPEGSPHSGGESSQQLSKCLGTVRRLQDEVAALKRAGPSAGDGEAVGGAGDVRKGGGGKVGMVAAAAADDRSPPSSFPAEVPPATNGHKWRSNNKGKGEDFGDGMRADTADSAEGEGIAARRDTARGGDDGSGHISSSDAAKQQPYLIIGIPSAPRAKELAKRTPLKETVLYRTIASIAAEMMGPRHDDYNSSSVMGSGMMARLVKVVVMNMRPSSRSAAEGDVSGGLGEGHATFAKVRDAFGAHAATADAGGGADPLDFSFSSSSSHAWLHFVDKPMGDTAAGTGSGKKKKSGKMRRGPLMPLSPPRDAASPEDDAEFGAKQQEAPTESARQQTNDVVALLDAVQGQSAYYYFAEDDMAFCGNTLLSLFYMIEKAEGRRTMKGRGGGPLIKNNRGRRDATEEEAEGFFSAIRCSFGLNGIVMHNGGLMGSGVVAHSNTDAAAMHYPSDVSAFADYLYRYQFRRPPDHLATEFFAQESRRARRHFGGDSEIADGASSSDRGGGRRRVYAFRYNIVNHLGGSTSTLREEEAWSMPACYTELVEPQVFAVEAWDPNQCPHSDLWPCDGGAAADDALLQMRSIRKH